MDKPHHKHIVEWLAKAHRDLLSAQRLAAGAPPFLDTAGYHAQQAAEKALKGVLVGLGADVPRIHDVVELVRLVSISLPEWEEFIPEAELLSPLATAFRHPFFEFEPEPKDYEAAFAAAERILHAALETMRSEVAQILSNRE